MKDLLKLALASAETQGAEDVAKDSFIDYHVQGMDYLCLGRGHGVTLKLYMTRPDDLIPARMPELHEELGFLVNPHDHRYSFTQMVVAGWSENILFREGCVSDGAPRYRCFQQSYGDAAGFTLLRETALVWEQRTPLAPGESYHARSSAVHTIRVSAHEEVCLLTLQGPREQQTSLLYMPGDADPPKPRGLYRRPTDMEAERLLDRACRHLRGALR